VSKLLLINQSETTMKTFVKPTTRIIHASLCCCLVLLFALSSCSKDESFEPTPPQEEDGAILKARLIKGPIELVGTSHFDYRAVKTKEVLSDGEQNFLTCTATAKMKGRRLILKTKEYFGPVSPETLYREVTFTGRITPSGRILYYWPRT